MRHSLSSTLLAVFAKFWAPGQVKTRLAATLGAQIACNVQREILRTTLYRFADFAERRALVIWPPDQRSSFGAIHPVNWDVIDQSAGDLGDKLAAFFRSQLMGGGRKVVVLGSDSPDLPRSRIEQAYELLDRSPVVLGPATDGGYYLIAMREFVPLFDEIAWSTDNVFQQTVERTQSLGIDVATLDVWSDVDDWQSLRQLIDRLENESDDRELIELRSRLVELVAESAR